MEGWSGVVTSLQVCPGHRLPMRTVNSAVLVDDFGLEGDRHAKAKSRRQVLLIEEEILDALDLDPGQVKENITTRGIDLGSLPVNTRLLAGESAELWITGPCAPCQRMDEIRDGLQEELRGRRGVLAWVRRGGPIHVGDRLEARLPASGDTGDGS